MNVRGLLQLMLPWLLARKLAGGALTPGKRIHFTKKGPGRMPPRRKDKSGPGTIKHRRVRLVGSPRTRPSEVTYGR